MKRIIYLLVAMCLLMLLSGCGSSNSTIAEIESDSAVNDLSMPVNEKSSEDTSLNHTGSLSLENITSEYVEPDFKVVYTLKDCLNYFDTEATDNVEKTTDSNGNVTLVTITDKNGQLKGEISVKYEDDTSITCVVSIYADGEFSEKIVFIFYDEDSIDIVAHVTDDSAISLYLYNRDGTFNSYVDSSGFSSLLTSAVLEGLGGVLPE